MAMGPQSPPAPSVWLELATLPAVLAAPLVALDSTHLQGLVALAPAALLTPTAMRTRELVYVIADTSPSELQAAACSVRAAPLGHTR